MPDNKVKTNILGVPVNPLTLDQVLELVKEAIATRKNLHIGVVNAAKIVSMRKDPELRKAVLESDIILPDGIAVVWAAKLLGTPLPERVAGIDLMFALFEYGKFARGNQEKYRVYCLGATEEVSIEVARRLSESYPNVVLAGRRNGYFSEDQEAEVAQAIGNSKADILLVAMTSPKKERFMAKWVRVMNVPVIHGVGGSFDVMAGKVKRAPDCWQKFGMEWLYRVKQEPGRLWKRYLVTNTQFCYLTFKAFISRLLSLKF